MMIPIFLFLLFCSIVSSVEVSDDKRKYYILPLKYSKSDSIRTYYAENVCIGITDPVTKFSFFNVTYAKQENYATYEECLSGNSTPKEVKYFKYTWYGLYETIPLLDHTKYVTYKDKDCSHYDMIETYKFNDCGIYTDTCSFIYKDWSAYGGYIYRAQYNGAYCEQYLNAFAIPINKCNNEESYGSMKYIVHSTNSTSLHYIIIFSVLLLFLF